MVFKGSGALPFGNEVLKSKRTRCVPVPSLAGPHAPCPRSPSSAEQRASDGRARGTDLCLTGVDPLIREAPPGRCWRLLLHVCDHPGLSSDTKNVCSGSTDQTLKEFSVCHW